MSLYVVSSLAGTTGFKQSPLSLRRCRAPNQERGIAMKQTIYYATAIHVTRPIWHLYKNSKGEIS